MSTQKPNILIIEKDSDVINSISRICDALGLNGEPLQTYSNATRAYAGQHPAAVFFNPEMNLIDPRSLIDEFSGIARAQKIRPAPILFMTDNMEELVRNRLKGLPGTAVLSKPIQLELVYTIFEKLSLVQLDIPHPSNTPRGKIKEWTEFIQTNDDWLTNLGSKLGA